MKREFIVYVDVTRRHAVRVLARTERDAKAKALHGFASEFKHKWSRGPHPIGMVAVHVEEDER